MPAGESPLDGARRELREETGVEAADWTELSRSHLSNSVSDEEAVLFLATGLTHGVATPDGTEALAVRWVPFDEVLAMTMDGRITRRDDDPGRPARRPRSPGRRRSGAGR